MMRGSDDEIIWILVAAAILLAVGFSLGVYKERSHLEQEAIAHHVAHFDGKTGTYTWNDEVTK